MPVFWMERTAVSRPEPGPFTCTSTRRTPCSIAALAARSAACCAANGVLLRLPLKPTAPDDAHEMTLPWVSVIVTIFILYMFGETLNIITLSGERKGQATEDDPSLPDGDVVFTTTSLSQNSNWSHLFDQAAGVAIEILQAADDGLMIELRIVQTIQKVNSSGAGRR